LSAGTESIFFFGAGLVFFGERVFAFLI
jgi:hypothetical protein